MGKKSKKKLAGTGHRDASRSQHGITWVLIAVIALSIIYVYHNALHGELTNWDDNGYITDNMELRSLNLDRVGAIFGQYRMGNYHPLTMLCYNLLFHFFRLNPLPYHVFNILVHTLNSLLVFYLIFLFAERKRFPAFVAALLFAVHPLHVESVAWIAESKDVLYTLFYLAALIAWIHYQKNRSGKYYLVALLFFVLSCLSKAMAVTLPLILLLWDVWKRKKLRWDRNELIEKLPFFVIALIFGIIALSAQESTNAIGQVTTTNFYQQILIAGRGVWFYIYKMILPVHLSAFYPYPILNGSLLPTPYLLSPVIVLALIYGLYQAWRKNNWLVVFGLSFYLINIAQVLQLLPVGSAVAADRYFYLSSVGLFYIMGMWCETLRAKQPELAIGLVVVLGCVLALIAQNRTAVWQNSLRLWQSVLQEYPDYPGASVAYNNIGMIYRRLNQLDLAHQNVQKALALDPQYGLAYKNLGGLYGKTGDLKNAEKYLLLAARYSPKDEGIFNNLGIVYAMTGKKEQALAEFNKALTLNPLDAEAHSNIGSLHLEQGRLQEAIPWLEKSLELNNEAIEPWLQLGNIYLSMGKKEEAVKKYRAAALLGSPVAINWLQQQGL